MVRRNPHPVLVGKVVPGDAEDFHHAAFLPVLIGHRTHAFDIVQFLEFQSQSVNSRPRHPAVLLHRRALIYHVGGRVFLAIVMTGPHHPVLLAPGADLLAERLFHAGGYGAIIMQAEGAPIPRFFHKFRQMRVHLVPPHLAEGSLHPRGIREHGIVIPPPAPGRYLRLVGEEAKDPFLSRKSFYIRPIGAVQEGGHRLGVHQIHPAGPVVPGSPHPLYMADIFVGSIFEQDGVGRLDRIILRYAAQGAGTIGFALPRDDAAGKTAGPFVLVVEPGFHPQFPALVHAHLHHVEPFRAQIGRQQARAAMQEGSAESALLHHPELAAQYIGIQAVV